MWDSPASRNVSPPAATKLFPNRLVLVLTAATVAFARGSMDHNTAVATKRAVKNTEALGTTLDVSVEKERAVQRVSFALHLANNTKKMLELRFPNGQTHDFIVLDTTGKEVWRWSTGRMFTQAIRTKLLKGREETVFEDSWSTSGLHGEYTAVAILRSENHPIQTSVEFVLP